MKDRLSIKKIVYELIMIVVSIIFIYPIFFMIMVAFRTRLDFARAPAGIPRVFTVNNIIEAFSRMNFLTVFFNSVIITGISVIIIIFIGSIASYGISRSNRKSANKLYIFFTMGMLIPIQICMIPLYKMMIDLNLLNNLLSCILVYCGAWMTTSVFIYVGFLKSIPIALDEAALIDGASKFRTFRSIIFPLLHPVNATVAIISMIGIWNDFLLPLLYLQKNNKRTIQLGLYAFSGLYGTDWTGMFSAMVISTIPIILIYIFLNNNIINGIVAGSLKG